MALFLVRWADGSTAILSARNEEELPEILDEQGDPSAAIWRRYTGPLWVEFGSVPEDPNADSSEFGAGEATVPMADRAAEMQDTITRLAFPNLWKGLQSAETPPAESLLKLLQKDMAKPPRGFRSMSYPEY